MASESVATIRPPFIIGNKFNMMMLMMMVLHFKSGDFFVTVINQIFCSTSLPLTSPTSTIRLCTVHSLGSVLPINLGNIKFLLETLGESGQSNPGLRGAA